jgi:archaemetzincin
MITLVPIGEVESSALETLKQPLTRAFGQRTWVGDGIKLPRESWDQRRGQYLASMLLAELSPPGLGDRVLGVVDVDIFAPELNFVFGEADITGRKAIISLVRLRQEFYGLPKNENLFQERALKEAVHELGHTYGLKHCPNPACVMHFSNSLRDTDLKGWDFCSICQRKISKDDHR